MSAEKKIGKSTYRVDQLGAREQQRILLRLGKVLGPALGGLLGMGGVDSNKMSAKKQSEFGRLLGEALSKADVDEADDLIVTLCEKARVQEKEGGPFEQVIFEQHFYGNLKASWEVAKFVFDVNFRGFFSEGGAGG